jgi:AbiV family abortive infection protein
LAIGDDGDIMKDLEWVNKAIRACAENADEHLGAARELRKTNHNNMSFNAAVLALEEIGKAVLIGMCSTTLVSKEPDFIQDQWLDDHAKKLFWAMWNVTFGRGADTIQDFQDFPHVANRIHLRRLDALYVDPKKSEVPVRIPDEEADGMIALAEYCIGRERSSFLAELDEKDRSDLQWFLETGDDPKLGGVIFGKNSFAKLQSFGGDVRKWVPWLRTEITRLDGYNQQLAEEELSRTAPSGDDALMPKWSLKVRLRSWSHSVRGKALGGWNKKSQFVKLSAARDRQELIVEFLVPKKILFSDLWPCGWTISNSFAIALNVATRGFFWWYLPAKTTQFFEEIRDLERKEPLAIQAPILECKWGNHALSDRDLEETLRIYTYLQCRPEQTWEPYFAYLEGLALVAKNDIHGRFEPTIMLRFYQTLRECARRNGDWDGSSPFLDAAKKGLEDFRAWMASIDRELARLVQLGEMLLQGAPVPNLTLRDAIVMKMFCDLYISRMAHEALGYKFAKQPAEEAKA